VNRIPTGLLACGIVCASVTAQEMKQPPAKPIQTSGPQRIVLPFKTTTDGKLYLRVKVGTRDLVLFIDTGATTIVDSYVAKELGIEMRESDDMGYGITGVAGKRQVGTMDLQFGTLRVTNFPVSFLDLEAVREYNRTHGMPPFDGLIGTDLLGLLRADISYGTHKLTLHRPAR
jgi:hypothetical protein